MCSTPPSLSMLETEVDQELRALNPNRNVIGKLVPIEVLAQPWRRDLSITSPSTGAVTVQTTVGDKVIPFLRAKTVCGQLGATIITGLANGNVKLARAIGGATASWLPEIGPGTDTDPNFDSFTVIPKRIQGSTIISRQLVYSRRPTLKLSSRIISPTRSVSQSITPRSMAVGPPRNRSGSCTTQSTRAAIMFTRRAAQT